MIGPSAGLRLIEGCSTIPDRKCRELMGLDRFEPREPLRRPHHERNLKRITNIGSGMDGNGGNIAKVRRLFPA